MEFIVFDPEPELEDDFSFAPTLEIIESPDNPSPFFLDPEVKSNTWSDTSKDGLNGQQYTYFLRKRTRIFH